MTASSWEVPGVVVVDGEGVGSSSWLLLPVSSQLLRGCSTLLRRSSRAFSARCLQEKEYLVTTLSDPGSMYIASNSKPYCLFSTIDSMANYQNISYRV